MVDSVYCLENFYFLIFHYYITVLILDHQQSAVLFLEIYIYIFLGISLLSSIFFVSFVTVSELFCGEVLEIFVILSAILLPIKSPLASADVWIAIFEAVLSESVADYLA